MASDSPHEEAAPTAPLHDVTRALLSQIAQLDGRLRALDDAHELDITLYVSRGRVARRPEIRVR